jgi:hypothetical protein
MKKQSGRSGWQATGKLTAGSKASCFQAFLFFFFMGEPLK